MLWWKGKQLKEISLSDGSKTQFEYDANGLRTQKRQYGTNRRLDYVVDYIWEDGKLQAQYLTVMVYTNFNGVLKANKVGPFSSKIIYDDGGLPQGFMLNDVSQFAFVRNLQGDVIAVIDENGNTAMEYSYDPWGNIEYHLNENFSTEQDALIFTALCPLTYRGYNYDFTTGLYYLQSRYYNPEWGRFINCDDTNILLATQGENHGANLFAYCNNNPVNKVDYTGRDSTEFVPIVTKILCIVLIMNYFYENNPTERYIAIQKNDDSQLLGKIKISLLKPNFANAIITCLQIDEQITYSLLALIALDKFKEYYHREFLFSFDCVVNEIKFHLDNYLTSQIYYDGIKDGFLSPGIIDTAVYFYLYKHCREIDINEDDVYNRKQAKTFDYYNGISDCYKNTVADPYMKKGKRKKSYSIPKSRTDWQRNLIKIGGVK